jgi:hypothetical protein
MVAVLKLGHRFDLPTHFRILPVNGSLEPNANGIGCGSFPRSAHKP